MTSSVGYTQIIQVLQRAVTDHESFFQTFKKDAPEMGSKDTIGGEVVFTLDQILSGQYTLLFDKPTGIPKAGAGAKQADLIVYDFKSKSFSKCFMKIDKVTARGIIAPHNYGVGNAFEKKSYTINLVFPSSENDNLIKMLAFNYGILCAFYRGEDANLLDKKEFTGKLMNEEAIISIFGSEGTFFNSFFLIGANSKSTMLPSRIIKQLTTGMKGKASSLFHEMDVMSAIGKNGPFHAEVFKKNPSGKYSECWEEMLCDGKSVPKEFDATIIVAYQGVSVTTGGKIREQVQKIAINEMKQFNSAARASAMLGIDIEEPVRGEVPDKEQPKVQKKIIDINNAIVTESTPSRKSPPVDSDEDEPIIKKSAKKPIVEEDEPVKKTKKKITKKHDSDDD